MKRKQPKKKTNKKSTIEGFIADAEKRGDLNPKHRKEFDRLLDDAAPPIKKK